MSGLPAVWHGCDKCNEGMIKSSEGEKPIICDCVIEKTKEHVMIHNYGLPKRLREFNPRLLSTEYQRLAHEIAAANGQTIYVTGIQGSGKSCFGASILHARWKQTEARILQNMQRGICSECEGSGCEYCNDSGCQFKVGPAYSRVAVFINGDKLRSDVQKSFDSNDASQLMLDAYNAHILVLDEFQDLVDSQYFQKRFFNLVEHRHSELLTTVVMSNYALEDIKSIDMRLYSRFCEGEYHDFTRTDSDGNPIDYRQQ